MDLAKLETERKAARALVEKGGPEAVSAARRLVEVEKIGTSAEFHEAALDDANAFEERRKSLSKEIEEARLSRKTEDKARLEKLFEDNEAEYYGSSKSEKDSTDKMEKEPKFVVLDNAELEKFIEQPISKVRDYIKTTYGKRVPGLEHQEYLINNPNKVPEQLKDGAYYYLLRGQDGDGRVPYVIWYGSRLNRDADAPDNKWRGSDRVLLLEE